jgi:uncharacterized protein (DUF169 family)
MKRRGEMDRAQASELLSNHLRLKTQPVAIKFLKDSSDIPNGAKQPSKLLGKRITICQAVTMARIYQWTMAIAKEDLICVPAMIAFGFTRASNQKNTLGKLFCNVTFSRNKEASTSETQSMNFLQNEEYKAIAMGPLMKVGFDPDTIAVYGNPAQVMRMIQGWTYHSGERVAGNFGGKVECTEYLIAPFKSSAARIAIPGAGDRIFSMTQDDEMVFALPGSRLSQLVEGLSEAGKKIGARYPITFYQNFQPEFPGQYKEMAKELEIF